MTRTASGGYGQRTTLASVTTTAGAVSLATGTLTAQSGFYSHGFAEFVLDVTAAATDVGDTLDVYVDTAIDGGTRWVNIIHFAQVLGNGGVKTFAATITPSASVGTAPVDVSSDLAAGAIRHYVGDQYRVRYAQVDATTQNAAFTFTVKGYLF